MGEVRQFKPLMLHILITTQQGGTSVQVNTFSPLLYETTKQLDINMIKCNTQCKMQNVDLTLSFVWHNLIVDGAFPSIIRKRMITLSENTFKAFAETDMSDSFPIAMAYVRWQKLDKMYPHEIALERGTLFPELDKPFCGITVSGGKR